MRTLFSGDMTKSARSEIRRPCPELVCRGVEYNGHRRAGTGSLLGISEHALHQPVHRQHARHAPSFGILTLIGNLLLLGFGPRSHGQRDHSF